MPVRHRFHPLTVTAKNWLTPDSIQFRLEVPADLSKTFRYKAGQHLPIRVSLGGEDLRRTYSICASEAEQVLDIAIRIQPHGKFGLFSSETLQIGDKVDVMPPTGRFQQVTCTESGARYAAFVAGSGITPVLSILKTILYDETDSHFTLFFGNRERSSIMLLETLLGLKNRYPKRLTYHFLLSRETPDTALHAGRLDAAKIKGLLEAYFPRSMPNQCYVCGPDTMIETVTDTLRVQGIDAGRVHSERFNAVRRAPSTETCPVSESQTDRGTTDVSVMMDGHTRSFKMQRDGVTVLDAALENGLDLPFACKGGVCSTCRVRVLEGDVRMQANFALQPWETQAGYVLACQSRPLSKRLTLDYDQV